MVRLMACFSRGLPAALTLALAVLLVGYGAFCDAFVTIFGTRRVADAMKTVEVLLPSKPCCVSPNFSGVTMNSRGSRVQPLTARYDAGNLLLICMTSFVPGRHRTRNSHAVLLVQFGCWFILVALYSTVPGYMTYLSYSLK